MLTRLKNWIEGSRRKSGERWEARRGHLSEHERHRVDLERDVRTGAELEDADFGPKVFDETRRGRPAN
jgi:hypothetical protein